MLCLGITVRSSWLSRLVTSCSVVSIGVFDVTAMLAALVCFTRLVGCRFTKDLSVPISNVPMVEKWVRQGSSSVGG